MHPFSTLTLFSFLACFSVAQLTQVMAEDAQTEKISLSKMDSASDQLKKIFLKEGRDGIGDLTNSKDPTVAIHAAWEIAKGKPDDIDRFLKVLESSLGTEPPKWWREQMKKIKIYPGNCHYVPGVAPNDKAEHRLTHKNFQIDSTPTTAGFPYEVSITDTKTKMESKITVWAVGRNILAGAGSHQIEILIHNDILCVFGSESHGAYAEQFRLTDGTPLLRFSTCYWFNFSERWNWNDSKKKKPAEQTVPSDGHKPSSHATSTDTIAPEDAH